MNIDKADEIYLSKQINKYPWNVERRAGLQAVIEATYGQREVVPLDWYIQTSERGAFALEMLRRLADLLSRHHDSAITRIKGECPLCAPSPETNIFSLVENFFKKCASATEEGSRNRGVEELERGREADRAVLESAEEWYKAVKANSLAFTLHAEQELYEAVRAWKSS